ncbi:MAG: hypothetical protein ACXAAO_10925 [Candidatus Thorarchaeota archaeon]|jgi:hypothetical protein
MSELETLRTSFVALLDGMWWGLRDNTGPLSMYEGYAKGFRQIGFEIAEKTGGRGAIAAAEIAIKLFTAIGLDVELEEKTIVVKKCPVWNRILERGLEYAFHVEEICWLPMLEGIGEKTGAKPVMESSLRLAHIESSKVSYKMGKAKVALDKGHITKDQYDKEIVMLDETLANAPTHGRYRFK